MIPLQVAQACNIPGYVDNVTKVLNALFRALTKAGINDHPTRVAAIATILVETGIFWPIEEEGDWSYFVNEFGEIEAIYHGRGLIQLSWSYNYRHYGQRIGVDLLAHPERALELEISCEVLVAYFLEHGIPALAAAGDWAGVRRAVNGGLNGWNVFYDAVVALERIADTSTWRTTLAQDDHLEAQPAALPQRGVVADLARGCVVEFLGPRYVTTHWAKVRVMAGTTQKKKPAGGLIGWLLRAHLETDLAGMGEAAAPIPAAAPIATMPPSATTATLVLDRSAEQLVVGILPPSVIVQQSLDLRTAWRKPPMPIPAYGLRRQIPDRRDRALSLLAPASIPPAGSLRDNGHMDPIYDQGALGSCTANAIARAVSYARSVQGLGPFRDAQHQPTPPARLYLYYYERAIEGTVGYDSGAYLRDGFKAINKVGICGEVWYPYDISTFTQHPSAKAQFSAAHHRALVYASVPQTRAALLATLASGYPVVIGIACYTSFESQAVLSTGEVPLPDPREQMIGGHAIVLTGWDDSTERYEFANSWGAQYGKGGYGTIPYRYVEDPNLAFDFWVLEKITA